MITIQVIRKQTATPVRGINVYIAKPGGGGVRDADTKDNGEARIDFDIPCNGKLVVNGQQVYEGEIQSYMKFYI